MRDLHDQPQVGLDHVLARGLVAPLDLAGKFDLLLARQKRGLPDLAQVDLDARIAVVRVHTSALQAAFEHESHAQLYNLNITYRDPFWLWIAIPDPRIVSEAYAEASAAWAAASRAMGTRKGEQET